MIIQKIVCSESEGETKQSESIILGSKFLPVMDLGTDFKWSEELTKRFIEARVAKSHLFSIGKRSAGKMAYQEILEEVGLVGEITVEQARKKWNNLIHKYKEMKKTISQMTTPCSVDWPYYEILDTIMSKNKTVREERTEYDQSSSAPTTEYVSLSNEDEDVSKNYWSSESGPLPPGNRKRKNSGSDDDPLLDLIREQTEALRQHEQSFNRFSDNVLSLLDRLVTLEENRNKLRAATMTSAEIIHLETN